MKKTIPLSNLKLNHIAKISYIYCSDNIKRRLLDLGIVPGTFIIPIFKSTSGDPIAYEVRSTVLAIRNQDAQKIFVSF